MCASDSSQPLDFISGDRPKSQREVKRVDLKSRPKNGLAFLDMLPIVTFSAKGNEIFIIRFIGHRVEFPENGAAHSNVGRVGWGRRSTNDTR